MHEIEENLTFYERGPSKWQVMLFGANSEVEDALLRHGRWNIHVYDDDPTAVVLSGKWAGDWDRAICTVKAQQDVHFWIICGVCSRPRSRAAAIDVIEHALVGCKNWTWKGIQSEAALVSPYAVVDPTALILDRALVMGATEIGKHAVLLPGAKLYHYSTVGEGAILVGGCTVLGRVRVGRGAWICGGAVVVPDSVIEDGAIVPAGTTYRPLKKE